MVENHNTMKTPHRVLIKMQLVHLGKILFNFEIVALCILFSSVLSFAITVVYYMFLIIVSLITLGLIYAIYPEISSWWSGGETLTNIAHTLAQSWKYTIPIVVALAIASIICLCFDRHRKHTGRIVASIIIGVIALVILVLQLIGGVNG